MRNQFTTLKRASPLVDLQGRPFAPTYWIPPRDKVAAQQERRLAA